MGTLGHSRRRLRSCLHQARSAARASRDEGHLDIVCRNDSYAEDQGIHYRGASRTWGFACWALFDDAGPKGLPDGCEREWT